MASIRKTRTGSWEVRWREGTKHRSRSFRTRLDAETAKLEIEQRGYGPVSHTASPTLLEFVDTWDRDKEISEATARGYAELLRYHILPYLGHYRVSKLNRRIIRTWRDERREAGAGTNALNKAHGLLRQILDYAVEPYELLNENPATPIKKIPVRQEERRGHRYLTAHEVESIRGWYMDHGDYGSATLVSVLAYVGIRPQDALALEWSDLGEKLSVTKKNLDGQIVRGSKAGEGTYERAVFVPEIVRADLLEWRELTDSGSTLIFPNRQGDPWSKAQFARWRARRQMKDGKTYKAKCFKLAAEEVGLGWSLTPYALRHTAATLFVSAGRSHTWVAHQLGHSPLVSLRTYQHLYAGEHEIGKTEDDYIREARGYAERCTENVRR